MTGETSYEVVWGDPTSPRVDVVQGDSVHVKPMDADGTRRLTVWVDDPSDEDGEREVAVFTVGPGHVLAYEERDESLE